MSWRCILLNTTCCVNRSEEHTSELQSHSELVCRLLLDKKNGRVLDDQHADARRFAHGVDFTRFRRFPGELAPNWGLGSMDWPGQMPSGRGYFPGPVLAH